MGTRAADVLDRERDFFNAQSARYLRGRAWIWRAIGEFNRNKELAELYDPRDKRVLLYGCGPASEAGRLIVVGAAHVAGIDISESEIARAWTKARAGGYAQAVDFRAGDAHATTFPDSSFDLVVGSAILHHLDIRRALAELRRILAPGGRAVFLEPLAHNPLLRLGRRLTPGARTADEHPFTVADWELCAEVFPRFWHREVELTSIPLMPLNLVLPRSWQRALAARVSALDDRLLARYPQLRRFARSTFLVLE
jgi:ubiquinone/menaquinone biosynthesis C-methylase UbiE